MAGPECATSIPGQALPRSRLHRWPTLRTSSGYPNVLRPPPAAVERSAKLGGGRGDFTAGLPSVSSGGRVPARDRLSASRRVTDRRAAARRHRESTAYRLSRRGLRGLGWRLSGRRACHPVPNGRRWVAPTAALAPRRTAASRGVQRAPGRCLEQKPATRDGPPRVSRRASAPAGGRPQCPPSLWLILPVVICLSQRLSHACLSTDLYTVKLRMAH